MFRALYTAASGMNAQQLNLDNVANNLANTSTAGFRRRRLQFTDLLYQNMIMPGSASTQQTTNAAGLQVGLGTKPGASEVLQIARRLQPDRQPARSRDSRPGILSGADAGRRNRLYALWDISSGCAGQHRDCGRQSARACHHSSPGRSLGYGWAGWNGFGYATGSNRRQRKSEISSLRCFPIPAA